MPLLPSPQSPTVAVTLKDGSEAELRPITSSDRALVEEGLKQLSPESRFARFGTAIDHLSQTELDYLTRIDQVTHVAWGAVVDNIPAGVARYVVLDEPRHAEVAVAVGDRFQGRGLGRALFAALTASARHRGIERFFFSVQPSNQPVLRMLQGIQTELDESEGLITGSFDLVDVASQPRDSEFVDLLESVRHPA